MSFRRWRDETLQCKCSMRHCTTSRRHCTCAIIHRTTSKWKCTWRNGKMNHYKKRIACWQDDDEVLQNKTERMKRYGWIKWSWIIGSGNEQIGLRGNVVLFTKTFVAYLLNKPQSFIRLFCANKHSFNLTQQGIPYFIKVVLGGKSKLNERAVIKVSYHSGTVYVLKLKGIIRMLCRLLSKFSKLIWEEIVFLICQ